MCVERQRESVFCWWSPEIMVLLCFPYHGTVQNLFFLWMGQLWDAALLHVRTSFLFRMHKKKYDRIWGKLATGDTDALICHTGWHFFTFAISLAETGDKNERKVGCLRGREMWLLCGERDIYFFHSLNLLSWAESLWQITCNMQNNVLLLAFYNLIADIIKLVVYCLFFCCCDI